MSGSTTPDDDEMITLLEVWMSETAALEQPPDDVIDQAVARARATPRRRRSRRRTVPVSVLGRAAAVVVLLVGALVGLVAITGRDGAPVQTDGRGDLALTGPYALVTVELSPTDPGLDVFAQTVGAAKQLLRHVSNSSLPSGVPGEWAAVSRTGWLALSLGPQGGGGWAFVDLLDPVRPPVVVTRRLTLGGMWGPSDLFAILLNGGTPAVLDPATGNVTEVPNAVLTGGGPDFIWSADGSGLLGSAGGSFGDDPLFDEGPRTWSMTPIDGSADIPGVGPLDPFRRFRYVTENGDWLTVGACWSVVDRCMPNSVLMDGTRQNQVVVAHEDGTTTTWYDDDLADAQLMESQFSADGQAIRLLLSRGTEDGQFGELLLARVAAPGDVEIVTVLQLTHPLDAVYADGYASALLAPDDSVAWIRTDGWEQLVPTDGSTSPTMLYGGTFAGFLPTAVVDEILS